MTTNEQASDPVPTNTELNLAQYWDVVVKHRRLIGQCVIAALIVGGVMTFTTTPTYKATVVLNVERDKASPFDIGSTPTGYSYDPDFLPTQTRLMKSREVAERVVNRLNLTRSPEFVTEKKGWFGRSAPAAPAAGAQATGVAINVQQGVVTTPLRGTNLVELSFIANSPKTAAEISNALADAYIDWNIESKFLVVGQATHFLAAQIEQIKGEIAQKEEELQAYGRQKDIISSDPQANVTMQKLESLNRDYATAVADRVAKEARYNEIQTSKADSIADSLSNGLISQLRNDQARMEREYAEKLNLFKPEWPAMQQMKAQIDKGRQHLVGVIEETVTKARDVAKTDYQTSLRREQSLKSVLQGQKSEAMALNSNAVEYNNLKTEVETKRSLLDTLMKRQSETEVTSRLRGERVSNIRVVDRALPPTNRFRPSYRRNAAFSLFAGAALGLALAFLIEYLDRSLRSTEEVEKILRLPALGLIPSLASPGRGYGYGYGYGYLTRLKAKTPAADETVAVELIPHAQPRSTIAEAYRAFRTALMLSRAGGVQTIVITSSVPAEGKTTTVVNLATVLGQLGKRVLIIDGDLHKPRIHEIFRVTNRIGLVSVLAENVPPTDTFLKTSLPNVFVMPSGPLSPNPSGLLSSDGMTRLLEFARLNFDFVLIDTPPVSPVADAIILGARADGVVLTVKGGRTPREIVTRVRDKLLRSNVRILGVLINNLSESASGYGRSYYYNYYPTKTAYGDENPRARASAG